MTPQPVEVFYSYSRKDERLLGKLREHLSNLKRQDVISEFYDRKIGAGREWAGEIDEHSGAAKVGSTARAWRLRKGSATSTA